MHIMNPKDEAYHKKTLSIDDIKNINYQPVDVVSMETPIRSKENDN